ncbi:glycosyl hydrolase family 95 catalytic domain-containing protein [Clostridium baratii]|uniref:glycoside hydrolase family 95 protein n=1 Tax=Clostridium baratii TaxID=1561 RepID=UPI00097FA829|nr:glycoside hydrolase family 95 protein [Clostridium baratii]AQM60478.1 hypothetical protein NPD11_2235 [Clostridium baratii]
MKLLYKRSAKNWNEALPIGNGHLAGMIFGGASHEKISLNDETIWYRGKVDRNNADSASHLSKIRNLIKEKKIEQAEELVKLTMFATPRDQSHYEVLGELEITHVDFEDSEIIEYERSLDLDTAVARTEFIIDDVTYCREYLTSFKENVMLIQLTTSKEKSINININLGRKKRFSDSIRVFKNSGIIMGSSAGGAEGISFNVGCCVASTDGECNVLGETITVRKATNVVIALISESNYWSREIDINKISWDTLERLKRINYVDSRKKHIAKYQEQYKRVSLILDEKITDIYVEDELHNLQVEGTNLKLLNTAFDYGRYLLISSSQPGGLPANLQGIWCDEMNPIWGSKYTININTQMNYWMVGPCDLPETELTLFDMLERMRIPGRHTAKKMYNARGFTCHHNTDGFYDTAPQSHAMGAAIWPMTVPWLCTHIWEYYQFFQDKRILEEHYSMIKEAALFYEDYLFDYNGYLVTGPSASPENKYRLANGVEGNICFSPTIDNQILRYFFESCLKIADILNDSSDFVPRIKEMKSRLPKTTIGKYGQIQEWLEDYEEVEVGHRHISPLFGLYPAHEIDLVKTPELAKAALQTIKRRVSNGHYVDKMQRDKAIESWKVEGLFASTRTGWSAAWLVHFYARLGKGDLGLEELFGILKNLTLPNLFCDHPPFQIDGNLGLVSGICELLLQSQNEVVNILPSLPEKIKNGEFKGFRVRGGQKISVKWQFGKVRKVEIYGEPYQKLRIEINERRMLSGEKFEKTIILDSMGNSTLLF